MPKEILVEEVLDLTTDRKSSKKNKGRKGCDVDCCVPDCNPDCCTAAFQRLDKLRQVWQLTQYGVAIPAAVVNRAGTSIAVPAADAVQPNVDESTSTWGTLERAADAFVNEVRYLNFEECGKLDQVTGWSVDVQTGNLYFYQDLPELGLNTTLSRAYLLSTPLAELAPIQKKQLSAMEPFWKLALKAVQRVNENPKTEGNICEIRDKCGNRFLVAINRAAGQAVGNSICDYNSQYSVVAVKLC